MKSDPVVLAQRQTFRLVRHDRDDKTWPNMADMYLEQLSHDSLGAPRWDIRASWVIRSVDDREVQSHDNYCVVALKLLTDDGDVEGHK